MDGEPGEVGLWGPPGPTGTAGSGGSGNTPLSFDSHPASPNAANDEFEGSSLAAKWTVINNTAAVVNYSSYIPGSIFIKHTGNTEFSISEAFAPGSSDFSVTFKGYANPQASFDSLGLQISDAAVDLINTPGSHNGISALFTWSGTKIVVQLNGWNSGTRSQSSSLLTVGTGQSLIYLHIQRVSGTYTFWYSFDGAVFLPLSTTGVTVPTFTVANIVLVAARYGATTPTSYFAFDFVRVNQLFL